MPAASVTRSIELLLPADEAWTALAGSDGLARWLGDQVEITAEVGSAGRVVDGGTTRRAVVTAVDHGRSLTLAWWREDQPAVVSTVSIEVATTDDPERCTVAVTEQIAGGVVAACAHASVADLTGAEHRWDARLDALLGVASSGLARAAV